MAELKITQQAQPGMITFNYEELKNEITEKAKTYETLVYTEQTMNEAKQDKANLNKLKKALNDERIKREKEWMTPFNTFKTQINDIIAIIDKPVQIIDKQVKAYEDAEKEKKSDQIRELWAKKEHPDWLELGRIWNEKWLNKTTSLKSIDAELDERLQDIESELRTIASMKAFAFEATEEYKRTLDFSRALQEGQRLAEIQKRKEEALKAEEERRAAEAQKAAELPKLSPQPNPIREDDSPNPAQELCAKPDAKWVSFQALLTPKQAFALRDYFNAAGIEFRPIN